MANNNIKNIWIDSDGDIDDYLSLAMFLSSSNVNVLGVSVHGAGATYLKPNLNWPAGYQEIFNKKFLICEGQESPSSYSNRYPFIATQNANACFGFNFPNLKENQFIKQENFISTLKNIKENFDLFIYGGATNWAWIISEYPEINEKINNVYVFGGIINKDQNKEIGIDGNIIEAFDNKSPYNNKVAEWNVFVDTKAYKKVLDFFKDKIKMFPINLSSDLLLTEDFAKRLASIKNKQAKNWIDTIEYLKKSQTLSYISIWSQIPTLYYLNLPTSKSWFEIETNNIDVVTEFVVSNDLNGKILLSTNNVNNINLYKKWTLNKDEIMNQFFEQIKK